METLIEVEKKFNFQQNPSLLGLKNWYVEISQKLREDGIPFKVILVFTTPQTLHYSRFLSGDKTDVQHIIKGLFFLKDNACNCHWEKDVEPEVVCYSSGRQKSRGHRMSVRSLSSVEFLVEKKKDYAKQWQNIANSMKEHNINPDIVKAIEDHLSGKTPHIEGFQNYWKKTDKPRIMNFSDIVGERTIPEMIKMANPTQYSNGEYLYYSRRRDGVKRDRSIGLQHYPDGTTRYYSASEYRGCGNGDYYTMYSRTMAFYTETD